MKQLHEIACFISSQPTDTKSHMASGFGTLITGPLSPKNWMKLLKGKDVKRLLHNGPSWNTFAKGSRRNNLAFWHLRFTPSSAAPQSRNPQRRPGYACGFAQSFAAKSGPNLCANSTKLFLREPLEYIFASIWSVPSLRYCAFLARIRRIRQITTLAARSTPRLLLTGPPTRTTDDAKKMSVM